MEALSVALVLAFVSGLAAVALLVALVRERRRSADVRTALGLGEGSVASAEGRLRAIVDAAATSQRELDKATGELASLLENLDVGVVRIDRSRVVTGANRLAHAILGRPPGTMEGRPLLEAVVDPRIERMAAASDADLPFSAVLEVPGGGGVTVAVARAPGEGRWLLLRDVSELVRLRRIRTEFVDNLSHELRTPVTTIGILAEALSMEAIASGAPLPGKVRERIGRIEVETSHLAQMVEELLDLARVERGEGFALDEDVDLAAVAAAAVERMRPFAAQAGVELVTELQAGSAVHVRGDARRLEQAVVNLVHNAVKFSGPAGHVSVSGGPGASVDEVVIAVRDDGIGIAAKDQARLFERFYKVDRARTRGQGTGLGLSIVRHIVEAHGGRVEVASAPGKGSTFTIVLPVARPRP